ncbi:MAG: segregation/condensation protein A [Pseudomonadota bacterium]|nr:segregation/condensation protein A [Pseudomonadota bacterium]
MPEDPVLELHLDGFDGPMDLLLDLARAQKVDLARISILALVEQYLTIVESARVRLDLAADWLVMAAWLAWLKSRLLLPAGSEAADEGEDAAQMLAGRLEALQSVRDLAIWLSGRTQIGVDVFARGVPEVLVAIDRSGLSADLSGLMRAYAGARRRATVQVPYRPGRRPLFSMQDALERLGRMLGLDAGSQASTDRARQWTALEMFWPAVSGGPVEQRAAMASMLLAGLELARMGQVDLRQDAGFGPILVRATG